MLILACSATKRKDGGLLPAWQRYDGPAWRVVRKWIQPTLIARHVMVLSAHYGLIAADKRIEGYDQRMTLERATEIRKETSDKLRALLRKNADALLLVLGKDYLAAVEEEVLKDGRVEVVPGAIGFKLQRVKLWSQSMAQANGNASHPKGTLFFLPEWDDRVDPGFDFATDTWSGPTPSTREDKYAHQLVSRPLPYDGMLVSLAQIKKKKGILRNGAGRFSTETSVREQLGLPDDMRLMGDCGAFTYLDKSKPPYSVEEAVRLYEELGFDIGASVDHVVFPGMTRTDGSGNRVELTLQELHDRIAITKNNAELFIQEANSVDAHFTPMGVVQALSARQFGDLFVEYAKMGYKYIGLGGLVPKRTEEIIRILNEIDERRLETPVASDVRLHLFGVMREPMIPTLAKSGVTSFDSASYLRKAWLRSEKNYLSHDAGWYAAIRVPFANSLRAGATRWKMSDLKALEQASIKALGDFDHGLLGLDETVSIVLEYDKLLTRKTNDGDRLGEAYTRTLEDMPWRRCSCPFCTKIGIHVVIFRGINRNRRRGFHNLWVFKRRLEKMNEGSGAPIKDR